MLVNDCAVRAKKRESSTMEHSVLDRMAPNSLSLLLAVTVVDFVLFSLLSVRLLRRLRLTVELRSS